MIQKKITSDKYVAQQSHQQSPRTDMAILEKEVDNEDQRELGPLKYLAETTGKDMNTVVNWFLLMIIFVFDPLAIALVVAANMAFTMNRPKDIEMSVPEGMEFNEPYPMPESWLEPEDNEPEGLEKIEEDIEVKEDLYGEEIDVQMVKDNKGVYRQVRTKKQKPNL